MYMREIGIKGTGWRKWKPIRDTQYTSLEFLNISSSRDDILPGVKRGEGCVGDYCDHRQRQAAYHQPFQEVLNILCL